MKLSKIDPKAFSTEITNYQNKIFYSTRGRYLLKAGYELNLELTREQVIYIHAVMVVHNNDCIEYGKAYTEIPVELLFTLMTPYAATLYKSKNKLTHSYMSNITNNCIIPLKDIILFKDKNVGQCRKFAILHKFVEEYYMIQQHSFNLILPEIEEKEYNYFKKPNRGVGFENLNRLNSLTVKAVNKIRESKFVFDAEFYYSKEGETFIKEGFTTEEKGYNSVAHDSLKSCLNKIHTKTSTPQYNRPFHLQDAGRVHTIGGCIQMPKWFRNRFILPVDPNNIRVEFDLKCAQLLILCDLLKEPDLKLKIISILENKGSIWNSIGEPNLSKKIKKIIIYSFCFGAELRHIPFLASREIKRLGIGNIVDKELVTNCFKGLLEPLLNAREKWLADYKTAKIIKSRNPTLVNNSLGYKFSLTKKAIDYYGGFESLRKDNSTKVGSQLLAHLCQGEEQYLIQSLIANHVEENILLWAYDGFVLEINPNKVNSVISKLMTNCLAPLEYEIIT